MNIHNLLSSAFSNADLKEDNYTVTFSQQDQIWSVIIRPRDPQNQRRFVVEFTIESDNYCSDIFISTNTLFSPQTHRLIFDTLTAPEFIEF